MENPISILKYQKENHAKASFKFQQYLQRLKERNPNLIFNVEAIPFHPSQNIELHVTGNIPQSMIEEIKEVFENTAW